MLTPTLKHIKSSWKLTQTNKTNTDCGWMMLFCVAKPHCWFFLFLQNHTFTYLLVSVSSASNIMRIPYIAFIIAIYAGRLRVRKSLHLHFGQPTRQRRRFEPQTEKDLKKKYTTTSPWNWNYRQKKTPSRTHGDYSFIMLRRTHSSCGW